MSGIPAGAGSLLGKRLGKYEILALLALGGTAEIYLARLGGNSGFEKYVVVKCLHDHLADDPDFVKMFLDEARLAAVLDHSNIVQTMELGEYENRYYMVMEFLAGLSLAMVVRRIAERLPGGFMPVPLVLNIAAQACAGLHYAHDRQANGKPLNMVHRDISPQNLVISFEGVVKVVDFGIARAEMRETKTKAGTIKGKFAYMSPEQCVAQQVDRRTDVFALGVIVHELLTGRRLFKRNSPYETYQAVLECAVDPPSKVNPQLDPAIDAIVMKAVAKDKDKRYPTAEALGDALAGYLHRHGKSSGGGELGRFFDQYFAQEIEEHGERMRELIEGREIQPDGTGWGDEDDGKAKETIDLGGPKGDLSYSLATGEIVELRPSEESLDKFVGRLASDNDNDNADDDDAPPPDRTRIEMNPLDNVAQLDQQVVRNSQRIGVPVPAGSVTAGPSPLPAPPPGPSKVAAGASTAAGPSKVPAREKPGARFPGRMDLPTVVAPDAEPAPELAPTALGDVDHRLAQRPTEHEMAAQSPAVAAAGSMSSTQYAMGANDMVLQHVQKETQPQTPILPQHPQITDYPVMPGGGRPLSTDLAPSNISGPQRSPYANAPFDTSSAASLMSPVGDQYPQADWERLAAQPAKVLPPWMLAALFAAALGGALLLTIIIAKIFS